MQNPRIETDSLGEVRVPENAYYGAQTQRAVSNFPISGLRFCKFRLRSEAGDGVKVKHLR
jgi:fumarate hydratase class II